MLLKLGGIQLWVPGASHVAVKLLYKPEHVYAAGLALAHVHFLGGGRGGTLHFRAVLSHPFSGQ